MKDLQFDGLSMVYELRMDGTVQALHNVSFDLEVGQGRSGPSGPVPELPSR
tara:strand:+ start:637 stop:789 length:153 start_codon:yes stop_codon:yes gene_type:complete